MKKHAISERKMIGMIRRAYKKRLRELAKKAMREVEMYDKRGHMLLSPGLKVRHKKSGYEYTVARVDGEGEEVTILLRHPDKPRFQPPESTLSLNEVEVSLNGVDFAKISGGDELAGPDTEPLGPGEPNDREDSLLRITKAEFEKDYEVD